MLEKHAKVLAQTHQISKDPKKGIKLSCQILDDEKILVLAYKLIVEAVGNEQSIMPAAEQLIDNFHLVDEQLRYIKDNLPPKYYQELPKLSSFHLLGYPRVYAIAWNYIAHRDSLFSQDILTSYIKSYQSVQPLTIGELWALPITLQIVMINNLRRICSSIIESQIARKKADDIADELLGINIEDQRTEEAILKELNTINLNNSFIVQLVQRLRFQEGKIDPVLRWIDDRLVSMGSGADKVVHKEHQSQSANISTVTNIINSMRIMAVINWRDFFEEISLVEQTLRSSKLYCQMDFTTRDTYRHTIENLSKGSKKSEIKIAQMLLKEENIDFGFYLLAEERYLFEKKIGYKLSFSQWFRRFFINYGKFFFLGSVCTLTSAFLLMCFSPLHYFLLSLAIFPASDLAISLLNRFIVSFFGPKPLPRLDLAKKIPEDLKTFVVIPTFLVRNSDIAEQVEQIEVHYLSNPEGAVYFALLTDWIDSATENMPNDQQLLDIAIKKIDELNQKYSFETNDNKRFFIFHRRRLWNESERKWIGWERKRGKLSELNQLLRGSKTTSFILNDLGYSEIPQDVKYIITLDADTRLTRGAVAQLVGTIAHPLHHPKIDQKLNRVIEGYGILQPRITAMLPATHDSTIYQRLYSGRCGVDPYASAVSDVYQDLFNEGSYTGKGIYNIDVCEQVLKNRIPENRLLSHDLFEGNFARCGLISDVEFFEEFPSEL